VDTDALLASVNVCTHLLCLLFVIGGLPGALAQAANKQQATFHY